MKVSQLEIVSGQSKRAKEEGKAKSKRNLAIADRRQVC